MTALDIEQLTEEFAAYIRFLNTVVGLNLPIVATDGTKNENEFAICNYETKWTAFVGYDGTVLSTAIYDENHNITSITIPDIEVKGYSVNQLAKMLEDLIIPNL